MQENIFLLAEILLLIAICFIHAWGAGQYVNFVPTNGTFQNFNPVRRLLAGQIPYRDFVDYLGMGHLYLGSLLTAVFGGDYHASLVAFSLLAFLSLAALSVMVGRSIFRDWKVVIGLTDFILVMVLIQPKFFVNWLGMTGEVVDALNSSLSTGNSARMLRGMILPVCVGIFALAASLYRRCKTKFRNLRIRNLAALWAVGFIAAFAFVWSNDYGISCWVCIAIMVFWVSFSRRRKFLLAFVDMLLEVAFSAIGVFIIVEIATFGHFREWLSFTAGTGGYQSWYFGSASWYVWNVDFAWFMLAQAALAIVYLVILFRKKGTLQAICRYGILGFANMTCFCAANEYRLLAGGSRREVALSVLFLSVLYEMVSFLGGYFKRVKLKSAFLFVTLVLGTVWSISAVQSEFITYVNNTGTYVASMGGKMTDLAADLASAHEFLNGANFWSTYATAQEVVEGKFQPSGTDYIIHVLGDEQREKYMEEFFSEDFEYVATLNKNYSRWEYWCERANWFFYQELYRNWHPVFENTYMQYWERNYEKDENTVYGDYEVNVAWVDDSTVKLSIQTDESINGVADVYIGYSVDKKNGKKAQFLIHRDLRVDNTGTITAPDPSWEVEYRRKQGEEYFPMQIANGYGELTLTACPSESTTLSLKEVSCERIYAIVR